MSKILSSIACNLDHNILLSALPLLESEKVEAIEWSFDTLYRQKSIPDWFVELLREFGSQNRLIGHGVYFSLFSGKWSDSQRKWLEHLKKVSTEFRFDHVTEHFGFMTGENFHHGAPLSIPFTNTTLSIGIDRLKRIQDACKCAVGLENLAFSYSIREVINHGEFLEKLTESINGFIILDLHNLYCQLHNFSLTFEELICHYPLNRVREIHISGGSWEPVASNPNLQVRRDTHDSCVPDEVFSLLGKTMDLCTNLKYVVLEQIGTGLATQESKAIFQQDFYKMSHITEQKNAQRKIAELNPFLPPTSFHLALKPLEDKLLHYQQSDLSHILENAVSLNEARQLLGRSVLARSEWEIEKWQDHMLETAISIAQKWKNGF